MLKVVLCNKPGSDGSLYYGSLLLAGLAGKICSRINTLVFLKEDGCVPVYRSMIS